MKVELHATSVTSVKASITFDMFDGVRHIRTNSFAGTGNVIRIGKHQSMDLRIEHEDVSGRHALIQVDSLEAVYILDLDSAMGTFVNEERVGKIARIKSGDTLMFGQGGCKPLTVHIDPPATSGVTWAHPSPSARHDEKCGPDLKNSAKAVETFRADLLFGAAADAECRIAGEVGAAHFLIACTLLEQARHHLTLAYLAARAHQVLVKEVP